MDILDIDFDEVKKRADQKFSELGIQNNDTSEDTIDYEAWTKFFSYYRYYIDDFATDILGIELFPFQRVILRAMARGQMSVLIACRGLGKQTT